MQVILSNLFVDCVEIDSNNFENSPRNNRGKGRKKSFKLCIIRSLMPFKKRLGGSCSTQGGEFLGILSKLVPPQIKIAGFFEIINNKSLSDLQKGVKFSLKPRV